jgi:Skp family chaperone for outer membrane proteins
MRKHLLFLFIALFAANTSYSQTKGTKIGYIDMEYILQNVPSYTEAQNQLEQKAQKWKQEIEIKKTEINKLKEALKSEKALLTKGLIEERETEIKYLEGEMLDYQQKRFGPNGDLMIQKSLLTKPIQDQVFTAVQDISEAKKYDFIFDKTSDLTMLFAAKRFDISDQVLRIITRSEKREQLTKKQLKEEEAKENKEDAEEENPLLASKQKILDERKAARDKVIEDRKILQDQKKKEAEEKRLQIQAEREAKRTGTIATTSKTAPVVNDSIKNATKAAAIELKQKQADAKAKTLEDRKKAIEDNKNAAEEKRKQILEEREAKKNNAISKNTVIADDTQKEATKTAAEAKQKQIDARAKTLEDRKKAIEDTKKAAEEKRKKLVEEKEAKKNGTVSETTKKEEVKITKTSTVEIKDSTKTTVEDNKQKQAEARAKTIEDRKKVIEDRKKALEEKRIKILEERQAAKASKDTLK